MLAGLPASVAGTTVNLFGTLFNSEH